MYPYKMCVLMYIYPCPSCSHFPLLNRLNNLHLQGSKEVLGEFLLAQCQAHTD